MEGTQTAAPDPKRMHAIARERGRGRKGLLSKKRLFADLEALGIPTFAGVGEQGLKHPKVGNETYGKQSCIYLYCADPAERRQTEKLLQSMGHRVNQGYSRGSANTEVTVSYFKGWHWWE